MRTTRSEQEGGGSSRIPRPEPTAEREGEKRERDVEALPSVASARPSKRTKKRLSLPHSLRDFSRERDHARAEETSPFVPREKGKNERGVCPSKDRGKTKQKKGRAESPFFFSSPKSIPLFSLLLLQTHVRPSSPRQGARAEAACELAGLAAERRRQHWRGLAFFRGRKKKRKEQKE